MKQLKNKLEMFFLAITLADECEFRRGLRIRPKPVKQAIGDPLS